MPSPPESRSSPSLPSSRSAPSPPVSVSARGFSLTSTSVDLPADDATYPDGPHADVINANCTSCHSASMALTQPALSADQWKATVTKMREVYKAPVAEKDVDAIVAYLTAMPSQKVAPATGSVASQAGRSRAPATLRASPDRSSAALRTLEEHRSFGTSGYLRCCGTPSLDRQHPTSAALRPLRGPETFRPTVLRCAPAPENFPARMLAPVTRTASSTPRQMTAKERQGRRDRSR